MERVTRNRILSDDSSDSNFEKIGAKAPFRLVVFWRRFFA